MTPAQRSDLRRALLEVEPWLGATEVGPRAVDAGPCDRCGELPRLLPTCGPVAWPALCRSCGGQVGLEAWCDGHQDEGRWALAWATSLPDHWDRAVTLWWVATGEIALDALVGGQGGPLPDERGAPLPDHLRRLLPG